MIINPQRPRIILGNPWLFWNIFCPCLFKQSASSATHHMIQENLKGYVQPKMKIQSFSTNPHANGKLSKQNTSGASQHNSAAVFSETTKVEEDLFLKIG